MAVRGLQHLPLSPNKFEQVFYANAATLGQQWQTFIPPVGFSFISILAIGAGGGGGTGAIGANSTAAGGGGGGSGGQTYLEMPISALPKNPVLYVSVGRGGTGAGFASYVSLVPQTSTNYHGLIIANGGGVGGNAAGATAGAAGAAAAIAANSSMQYGWAFAKLALAGQAGIIGGVAVAGGNLTLPTTGLRVTGGTGGGGLPAAAATGTNGGGFVAVTAPTYFPSHTGGVGSATATNPADFGRSGFQISPMGFYWYGGTGGASTHGTATGGGLVQARGGDGAIGCGGGGMGGALTGSTAALQAKGGDGIVIINCW